MWGWDAQREHLASRYASTPLERKAGQAVWRGRYTEPRDWLRKRLADCPQQARRRRRRCRRRCSPPPPLMQLMPLPQALHPFACCFLLDCEQRSSTWITAGGCRAQDRSRPAQHVVAQAGADGHVQLAVSAGCSCGLQRWRKARRGAAAASLRRPRPPKALP